MSDSKIDQIEQDIEDITIMLETINTFIKTMKGFIESNTALHKANTRWCSDLEHRIERLERLIQPELVSSDGSKFEVIHESK